MLFLEEAKIIRSFLFGIFSDKTQDVEYFSCVVGSESQKNGENNVSFTVDFTKRFCEVICRGNERMNWERDK